MWIVRLTLFGLLAVLVGTSRYFLKHREKYGRLLENGVVNLVLVLLYNLLCYLIVGLPSEQNVVPPPAFLEHSSVQRGFSVVGQVWMGLAALVMVAALAQRKALGGQDSKEGLLTSGIYRYARHPIYTGIVWMSLGLALASVNWAGLLMVPAVFGVNVVQAVIEERHDVGVRFQTQYEAYRKRTRMFGPVWCWAILAGILALLAGLPYLSPG
jgi:protein-S-isoprenylcysteine O-methyltransferase Ste14